MPGAGHRGPAHRKPHQGQRGSPWMTGTPVGGGTGKPRKLRAPPSRGPARWRSSTGTAGTDPRSPRHRRDRRLSGVPGPEPALLPTSTPAISPRGRPRASRSLREPVRPRGIAEGRTLLAWSCGGSAKRPRSRSRWTPRSKSRGRPLKAQRDREPLQGLHGRRHRPGALRGSTESPIPPLYGCPPAPCKRTGQTGRSPGPAASPIRAPRPREPPLTSRRPEPTSGPVSRRGCVALPRAAPGHSRPWGVPAAAPSSGDECPSVPSCPQPGCQTSQGEQSRCQPPQAGERDSRAGPGVPGWRQRDQGDSSRRLPVGNGPGAPSASPRRGRPAAAPGPGPAAALTLQPVTSRPGGAQQEQRQQRTEHRAPCGRRYPHAAGAAGAERSAAGRGGANGEGPALPARRKQRAVNHGRASPGPRRALGRGGPAAAPAAERSGAGRGAAHRARGCGRPTDRPGTARLWRSSRSQKLSVAGAGSPGGQAVWGRLLAS